MPLARLTALALRCALLMAAAHLLQPVSARGSQPPGPDNSACSVLWQVTAVPGDAEGAPLRLQLVLRFTAGRQTHTGLHLPGGSSDHTELPAVPGSGARWATSHGTAQGPGALWVLGPSPVPLAQRVQQSLYAGGALQWQAAPGVLAVLPTPSPWPMAADAVAQAGARVLAAQQRQWPQPGGPEAPPPWLLLVLPTAAAAAPDTGLAIAWHQALALQLPPDWAGRDTALQALLSQAMASAWAAERFGPLAHAGRGDAALRAWFSDGWAGFLARRSLLREGLWTPDDFAADLNGRSAAYLAEPARALPNAQVAAGSLLSPQLAALLAMRGEWLALQWHQALRHAGHPGLDAVLRQQQMAAGQARRGGPISASLATHRVVAALRTVLHDQPMRDLQQHIQATKATEARKPSIGTSRTTRTTKSNKTSKAAARQAGKPGAKPAARSTTPAQAA